MSNINQAIQAGYAAFQRGAYSDARRQLQGLEHPNAIHLLALVEKNDGNLDVASDLLDRVASMAPNDADIANNRASLARDRGQMELAESEFRRALELRPGLLQASIGLGRLLIDTESWEDAVTVYEKILTTAPDSVAGRYGFGTAILGAGDAEQAKVIFDALIREGNDQPEFRFMRARARLELGEIDAALEDLKVSHGHGPSDFSLRTLAGTYWMLEDKTSFEKLLADSVQEPGLVVTSAEILRQSGNPERALSVLEEARRSADLSLESWSVAANSHIDLNQPLEAEKVSRQCLQSDPNNRLIRGGLITSLLMQGKAADAMPVIQTMRETEPNGQHWIAYEATALRLLGSDKYEHLVDLDRFVRAYEIAVPDGYANIEDFNQQLLNSLDQWHPYKTHPLDQSLRDGSQVPRDLTCIDDPAISAYTNAIDAPIREYMAAVGYGKDHPLTSRNTGNYRIAGCWSVRLHGGGRHVNHVHPEGWISSCYYISVPAETSTDTGKAGWIKFAEPPFETSPPTPEQKWIQPQAGMLVLFPSYLWHGTQPIHDGSIRVTAPFDAVPV